MLPWYCGIHPEVRELICITREFPEETIHSRLGLDKSLSCYVVLKYEHLNLPVIINLLLFLNSINNVVSSAKLTGTHNFRELCVGLSTVKTQNMKYCFSKINYDTFLSPWNSQSAKTHTKTRLFQ